MNCSETRSLLPDLLYGDLAQEPAAEVARHLDVCPACQAERAALVRVRDLLNRAAPPRVQVDLPRLYTQAFRVQQHGARRWRRAGLALLATAAALFVLSFLNLEVRVDGQQLVLRWGALPEAPAPIAPTQLPPARIANAAAEPATLTAAEWQTLRQLIHAVAETSLVRDQEQGENFRELQQRLVQLERRLSEQWETSRRYFSALATANLQEQKP